MSHARRCGIAAVVVLVLLSACSTQPAPREVTPLPATAARGLAGARIPAAAAPRQSSAFCGGAARVIRFADLGLERQEAPFEVAVTDRYVWVLVDPARLVRISRGDGTTALARGEAGEVWTAMDADPRDGSIWIAARDFGFVHLEPDLGVTRVRLQHAVEGKSGFVRLLVGPDGLYAQPFCSDRGVWRIGWDGKPKGTAFPAPQAEGAADVTKMECSPVRLERGADGRLLARDPENHAVYALGEGGKWSAEPADLFAGVPRQAQHFFQFNTIAGDRFAPFAERLIDWKGRPIFLGHQGSTTVFFPLGGDAAESTRPAACSGRTVRNLATGAGGFAALLPDFVIFGDLADAPELP
jgi:hypothetical protein